ncbi:chalcone isomerase family protein [Chitinibacter sp. SCUT-21]|uniref:chalcone isomerase family protein n=1 Tax=Chitinibacter sp. SCUT-21 TaxID=2970891 RepID=UPI0035A69FB4
MLFSLCCKKRVNTLQGIAAKLLLLACLGLIPMLANANAWREQLPQAKVIGNGDLRWFGLRIYTAKLWSEQPRFDANAPFALELTYHRSISREQFVSTSLDEIRRLFAQRYSAATLQRWESEMQRAFTDVNEGDQLIGVYLPNVGCRFYNSRRLLAEIRDPEFAKAFFAIWFDVRSKDSGLRAQLLGDKS